MKPPISLIALLFAFPAAARADSAPPIAELPGPVVIAGAGKLPRDARDAFFELAGKEKARIAVLGSGRSVQVLLEGWRELKPASLVAIDLGGKGPQQAEAAAKALGTTTGIWVEASAKQCQALAKQLKRRHEQGIVFGGRGEAAALLCDRFTAGQDKLQPGLGILPGLIIRNGGQSQFDAAIDRNPELVGLALEEGSAIVFRGRLLRVIGEKSISLRIAGGGGKPVARQQAEAGSIFDLYQLRRAAANRAAKHPFPPARPKPPRVEHGTLVIVGGGGTTPEIMNTFFDKAGGKDRLIIAIPTTAEDGPRSVAYLRRFGATNVKALHTLDRKVANDPKFSEELTKAGGVWFGGGRQWRFIDSFEGTLVEKRFHELLARGGVIGGSSAGASIQSEFMPRGHPLGNTVMAAEGYERGFGFLPGCAVDQHFFARRRMGDMTALMRQYPQYLGIGIDEATAIVVSGSTATVMGRSKVAFYDTGKKPGIGYEWDARGNLVWFEQDYEEVFPGERYDLEKRRR